MVLIFVEVDVCTDVVSVSISVINKCTATHTVYITAGMNLLCHVHTIITILYYICKVSHLGRDSPGIWPYVPVVSQFA